MKKSKQMEAYKAKKGALNTSAANQIRYEVMLRPELSKRWRRPEYLALNIKYLYLPGTAYRYLVRTRRPTGPSAVPNKVLYMPADSLCSGCYQ